MLRKPRLFTPGPTPLLPAAQLAMASSDLHHRTAEFRAIYSRVLEDLKTFVGTTADVLPLTSSGTGAMEAALVNLTSPGDRVLVLSCGKFGERWAALAKAYGCQVDVVSAPYGQAVAPSQVREQLANSAYRAVLMQATESSTGVRLDVQSVAAVARDAGALLVVDAITGLGTTRLEMDAWGIDVLIGGSQKALMIPPGLAYLAVSESAWSAMEQARNPRYYFDLRRERANAAKGEAAFTPSVALILALAAAMEYLRGQGGGDLAVGRVALIHNAETAAAMTRAAAEALGLQLFAPASPAAALTALLPPQGLDSGIIVRAFREKFGAVLANGQGEMKGKIFRIAHLGYYDYMDTIAAIAALEQVLAAVVQPRHVEFGAGVRAAQVAFARANGAAGGAAR